MKITPDVFEAFLKCPTKCWLKATAEPSACNTYAEWVKAQNDDYRATGTARLVAEFPDDEVTRSPDRENVKVAKWRLASSLAVQAQMDSCVLESYVHAVERVPAEGRGKPAEFIPIRFVFTNKLGKDDKLLLAFDAFALSKSLGREISLGKIIHGDDHATLKVKTSALAGEVGKHVEKIGGLLSSPTPPDLVLNRHCAECEFQARCRKIAIETDDLSLLGGMSAKERENLRSKGIFSVTQLSYTFRPRRRPKRQRDKREKYHHSLKALAIREKKTYVVGTLDLKIEGTPVYLDVEALPDLDFYYLIGARVKTTEGFVQHSFWADDFGGMAKMWADFLNLLAAVKDPCLIHYGSFETTFLKRMNARFGVPLADAVGVTRAIEHSVNLLSTIYAQIYFSTFSNSLKEITGRLGFKWSEADASGSRSVIWRHAWSDSTNPVMKDKLITYNAEDCQALVLVEQTVSRLVNCNLNAIGREAEVIRTDELERSFVHKWRVFSSPLSDLEFVNNAAYWDYQRDRIYARSPKRRKPALRTSKAYPKSVWNVDKVITEEASTKCPRCQRKGVKHGTVRSRTLQEVVFGRFSLKRRVIRYDYQRYWCSKCNAMFGADEKLIKRGQPPKYGRSLLAFVFYQVIELNVPFRVVAQSLNRLFGLLLNTGMLASFKEQMAHYYSQTQEQILKRIVAGELVHADETHVSIKGKRAYVWVFTNMHEVAFLYSETREGDLVQTTLDGFKGLLVSDFYTVYDSIDCPQQKCLIHLVRDLNGVMLDNPYDEEMKQFVTSFGELLKTIVEDVDRRGLKKRFLRKHLVAVERFYRKIVTRDYQSPVALTCVERFEKNRNKLFTFLRYDGVPWNNNNAEHAIKAFARLRDVIEGSSTEKGIKEYLTLLSVCQTCKYMDVDFLDFLRSGEKDIQVFGENKRRRKRRSPPNEPKSLPADESAQK